MRKVEREITFKDVAAMFDMLLAQGSSVEEIMTMKVDPKVSDFVRARV